MEIRVQWTKRVVIVGVSACAVLFASGFPGTGHASPALATAPTLGTAASFAVLAGSAVTNTGPTLVSGNLGVSPGSAISGFPPGVVIGGSKHAGDAVAAQAQSDALTAYNNLAGQPCNFDLTGQDLGGKTLTSGVYCFSSSAQLTGPLTLNGQGDPNSVFIFQIGSTLTTASASSVLLTNLAQPCNVFWQVGSSATLGTDTTFVGNILALTSITLTTSTRINGRALAHNGAVTMDTNHVTASQCASPPTATPTSSGSTATPIPTATRVPATSTATPVPASPTATTVRIPTATSIPAGPTATAFSIPTATSVVVTPIAIAATATAVAAATNTAIAAPTSTAMAIATNTAIAAATSTALASPTATTTAVATSTATASATSTAIAATSTAISGPTATSVTGATATPTSKPGKSATPVVTATSGATPTSTRIVSHSPGPQGHPMPTVVPRTGAGGTSLLRAPHTVASRGAAPNTQVQTGGLSLQPSGENALPRTGGGAGGGTPARPIPLLAILGALGIIVGRLVLRVTKR